VVVLGSEEIGPVPDDRTAEKSWRQGGVSLRRSRLLQQWVAAWRDLIEFEIVPVVASADTPQAIEPLL
jgi:hypothetical protein